MTICALQIVFNVGDSAFNLAPAHYNGILAVLNVLELLIIMGLGIPTYAVRTRYEQYFNQLFHYGARSDKPTQKVPEGKRSHA